MSNFEDYVAGERGGIPWAQAAAFFVELKDVAVPEPVLTKEAKAGLLKLAFIQKVAQTPEEAAAMTGQQAMTDPNVAAALDYQEMAAEREALQQTLQGMQQQLLQSAQAQQAAEQQVQQLSANTEALQGQLEQANAGRQQAIEQAVQAKDQALSEVVNQQQHRAQIMQTADQLAQQLKQVAATSPNEAMAQQQAQAQQDQAMMQAGADQAMSAKAQKEMQEAQSAGVNAQVQGEQAQMAQQQDAAKQEQAAAAQQQGAAQQQQGAPAEAEQAQQGAAGAPMPKQSSDRVREAALRILEKRAASRLDTVRQAYRLGSVERGVKEVAKQVGAKTKDVVTKDLPLSERAAYHLGKHRNKYLAGGGVAAGTVGTAAAVKALKDRKEKKAAETCKKCGKGIVKEGEITKCGCGVMKTGAALGTKEEWDEALGVGSWKPPRDEKGNKLYPGNFDPGKLKKLDPRWRRAQKAKTAAPLGIAGRLAYTGAGAAVGGGHAAIEAARHSKKHGKGKATDDEIDSKAKVLASHAKMRRDPTYLNKLRFSTARYKASLEQADREHPAGAIARGAVKGALIGGIGGGAIHSLGGRAKAFLKSRQAAKGGAEAAKKAAK